MTTRLAGGARADLSADGVQNLWGLLPGQATPDLASSQVVIVIARWILIAAALLLTMMPPWASLDQLRVQFPVILFLAVGNFFLHAHLLRRRPTPDWIIYAASAADLAVITTLVVLRGGFDSGLYIFYFPALLAIGLAFDTRTALLYAVVAAAAYGIVVSTGVDRPQDLLTRLAMLLTVAVCGAVYRRIEMTRRDDTRRLHSELTGIDSHSLPATGTSKA